MLEVARILQALTTDGWKPRRDILFASWDAEEFGLVGSTEWVEHRLAALTTSAVAYLNVDIGATGPHFYAAASPLMFDVIEAAARQIRHPENASMSLWDEWEEHGHGGVDGEFASLGSGSDFTPFFQHAGISSMDASMEGAYGVYHSKYDSIHWLKTFGDPEFKNSVRRLFFLNFDPSRRQRWRNFWPSSPCASPPTLSSPSTSPTTPSPSSVRF
jgi:N-acetylated-alpha-linked acidic dipeptidase